MFPIINWNLFSLESASTCILVVLVVIEMFQSKDETQDTLGILSILATIGLLWFWFTQQHLVGVTFSGMFVMDSLAWFFKAFFLIAMVFVFAMTKEFFKSLGERRNEFYLLLWL